MPERPRRAGRLAYESDVLLGVDIHYWVLEDGVVRVTDDDIAYQHALLNACFTAQNTDRSIVKGFTPASANIVFNHVETHRLTVTDAPYPTHDTWSYAKTLFLNHYAPDCVNVYFTRFGPHPFGKLLGLAWPNTEYTMISYDSIGNGLSAYSGKTLVHEVGHLMSLPHTFLNSSGQLYKPFNDLPASRYPNSFAKLSPSRTVGPDYIASNYQLALPDGRSQFEAAGWDNWKSEYRQRSTGKVECVYNFMDYTNDRIKTMFTADQCEAMRTYLVTRSPFAVMTNGVILPPPVEPLYSNGSPDQDDLFIIQDVANNWVYILYALAGLIGIVLLFGVIRWYKRRKSTFEKNSGTQ